jgi:two-component system, sensor histidine kinase and response regulator
MPAKSKSLRYVALAAALLLSLAGAVYIRYELVFLVPYILAVLIVYRWGRPKDIYVVAAFVTVVIVAGHWLEDRAQSTTVHLGEHLIQIATLWLVALLLAQRLRLEQRLARQQVELEAQVRARTAALEAEIAERRAAEAALQASEEQYRLLADSANELIWAVDLDGDLTYVSPSVTRLRGYSAEETFTFRWEDRVAEGFGPTVVAVLQNALAAARAGEPLDPGPYIFPQVHKSGAPLWSETTLSPMVDGAGNPVGVRGTTRDITKRQQALEALRRSEERFATLFRISPGGILLTGRADGRYIDVNDTFAELVGYTREELIGRSSLDLGILPAADRNLMLSLIEAGGTVRGADAQIIAKTGEAIDVVYFIEPVEIDGEACLLSSVFDNRARKQMEQQLRGLNEELEDRVARRTAALAAALADLQRASRLKDEFMGVMSHELRTPLTGIMASAELLESEVVGPLNARQLRHVHSIMQGGERLLTMVDSILSYTSVVAGNVQLYPERCELAPLLAGAAADLERRREQKHQSLSVAVDPPDLAAVLDRAALTAILDRLLDNAVKFTPAGGVLGLEARLGPTRGRFQIVVWDTGIGIDADQLAKVTEPFIQADSRLARAYEGAGLGLAYVTQMLDLLGGSLEVESNPGQGSRFIVTLPSKLPLA